jgi:hypothetical protein
MHAIYAIVSSIYLPQHPAAVSAMATMVQVGRRVEDLMAGRYPTEEQYLLGFWPKKTNLIKSSAKKK